MSHFESILYIIYPSEEILLKQTFVRATQMNILHSKALWKAQSEISCALEIVKGVLPQ